MCSILIMFLNFLTPVLIVFSFSKLNSSDLSIKIQNIENSFGFIHIALYDDSKNFPKQIGKKLGIKKKANDFLKDGGVILKNLNSGTYAVAVYHDENSNGRFDRLLGIPIEKYGFSNDAPVFFGPPKFSDASFKLIKNVNYTLLIKLR